MLCVGTSVNGPNHKMALCIVNIDVAIEIWFKEERQRRGSLEEGRVLADQVLFPPNDQTTLQQLIFLVDLSHLSVDNLH